ncbi:MAG: uroporphyrinogen decarboxylase family protein [Desulfatirhabdiaceae bacterium]
MAKQMLLDAYRGKRTPKAPWVPYAGVHCAFLINEPAEKMLKDPNLLAKGVVHTAKRYKADGIPLLFDLSVEANSIGCDLKWWPDNVPSVTNHPCSGKTPSEAGLTLPSKDSGRWPTIFEAARIAKPQLEELDCAMMGLFCGPLTLASHLAGVRIFTDVYKKKEFAHDVIKFAGQVGARAAQFYADMGCDIIAIVDPVASQIKSETFKEFVTPNCQEAIKTIHAAGKTSSFFICGDCTKVMEDVCTLGTHGFAIDEQLNLVFVRDMARKHGVGFGGNLKLTLALSLGLLSSREDAIVSLAAGGQHGFTFAPG